MSLLKMVEQSKYSLFLDRLYYNDVYELFNNTALYDDYRIELDCLRFNIIFDDWLYETSITCLEILDSVIDYHINSIEEELDVIEKELINEYNKFIMMYLCLPLPIDLVYRISNM